MTIVLLRNMLPRGIVSGMTADTIMLVRLLTTAALVAATAEYAAMIRRRVLHRADAREHRLLADVGLQSLVRVFLADAPPAEARG
ncbi:MAG: hypothetical protein H0W81_11360 [Chloroflexi bacterium]|nr:hypothetical protein [Chloroflexota bacterium]